MSSNVKVAPVVELLADRPDLIPHVGRIRWREWGKPPESVDEQFWIDLTQRETGKAGLPISWVAVDGGRRAIGAVGLIEFDSDGFRDRSPWLVGMVVDPIYRGQGVGTLLVRALESWAPEHGFPRVWVATGGHAVPFYEKCGWRRVATFTNDSHAVAIVLERNLDA